MAETSKDLKIKNCDNILWLHSLLQKTKLHFSVILPFSWQTERKK